VEVKCSAEEYKCRSAASKIYKTLKQGTEAELEIARNRQKIIAAYEHRQHSRV
jgi:hypothetical protein